MKVLTISRNVISGIRRRSNQAKPVGALVKLRVAWGDVPPCPATLKLPTGRKYLVVKVHGKTLHCVVLDPLEPVEEETQPVIAWQWATRRKRALR